MGDGRRGPWLRGIKMIARHNDWLGTGIATERIILLSKPHTEKMLQKLSLEPLSKPLRSGRPKRMPLSSQCHMLTFEQGVLRGQ